MRDRAKTARLFTPRVRVGAIQDRHFQSGAPDEGPLVLSRATGIPSHPQQRPRRTGPQGRPKGGGKLEPFTGFFEELVTRDPSFTLHELREAPAEAEGVTLHNSSISDLLSKLGYTSE